jgi:hypothetical protein
MVRQEAASPRAKDFETPPAIDMWAPTRGLLAFLFAFFFFLLSVDIDRLLSGSIDNHRKSTGFGRKKENKNQ